MAVKFICSCGKKLRAREENSSRRSFCPACGAPVGIPSLEPTHRGAPAGPMTPAEIRLSRRRAPVGRISPLDGTPAGEPDAYHPPELPETAASISASAALKTLAAEKAAAPAEPARVESVRRPWWDVERNWYECLIYPFRAGPLVAGLAIALALASGIATLSLAARPLLGAPSTKAFLEGAIPLSIPLAVLCYTFACLNCLLSGGVDGEVQFVRWPAGDLLLVLKSAGTWVICFLTGPVVPAGAALFYWVYGGLLDWFDWIIIAELVVLALGYWLFALLAVCSSGRLPDANPVRIGAMVQRLGYRSAVIVLVAAGLVYIHGLWLFRAIDAVHTSGASGWMALAVAWFSALFTTTFVLRLFGIWWHHANPQKRRSKKAAPAE